MNNNPNGEEIALIQPTISSWEKWRGSWMLTVLAAIYLVGELGHYLIGVVSRPVAQDLHYGEIGCIERPHVENIKSGICEDQETEEL